MYFDIWSLIFDFFYNKRVIDSIHLDWMNQTGIKRTKQNFKQLLYFVISFIWRLFFIHIINERVCVFLARLATSNSFGIRKSNLEESLWAESLWAESLLAESLWNESLESWLWVWGLCWVSANVFEGAQDSGWHWWWSWDVGSNSTVTEFISDIGQSDWLTVWCVPGGSSLHLLSTNTWFLLSNSVGWFESPSVWAVSGVWWLEYKIFSFTFVLCHNMSKQIAWNHFSFHFKL